MNRASIKAKISAEVLGATVRISPRPLSETNKKRAAKTERVANRLALLPLSLKKKAGLAAMTCSAIAAWGTLFGCRVPTVKGCADKFDGSSRDLQQLLLLGHHSDLVFVACQRLLKAMGRWSNLLLSQGRNPLHFRVKGSAIVQGLNACLSVWG